jgi:alpha-beta hydrolase superfamily lysophospholipase
VSEKLLSLMLATVSRTLLLRDRLTGRMANQLKAFSFEDERLVLLSGGRKLSAVYISAGQAAPVFLICHGIGERVEYWQDVQTLLKKIGISSLVFNYGGFGASTGTVCRSHCEEDAVTAYKELVRRGVRSIFLLGFSLGTGVVTAIASHVDADGVILCEGFSSLREAGLAAGLPRWLTLLTPDAWPTAKRVSELDIPILVVHSEDDRLFPFSMAEKVMSGCKQGEQIVVAGYSHNAPIFEAAESYWEPIASWAKRQIESKNNEIKISRR